MNAGSSPFRPDVLAGKRVLITGGGTGLGRVMAGALAAHGADVHLWGRRPAVLEEATGELGERAAWQAVDVRKAETIEAAMDEIWHDHGPLTGVINSAAANFIAPTEGLSPRAYEAVNSTIQDGSYFTTHAAGTRWIREGLPGSVLSMLTTWIWTGSAFVTPSAMGKAAVHAMTMSLAVEWAKYGIRLNALTPGPFPTEFAWDVLSGSADRLPTATDAEGVPMGRFGRPEELGNLVVFLMTDACEYMTGAELAVDGGQRLAGPGTFAGLAKMTDEDWADVSARARAASEQAKAERAD